MSTESQNFTHRVTAQADWFIRQPSSGVTQELREFIHNSRAVGLSLNAQRVWATLEDNVSVESGQQTRTRLALEDDGVGMSFDQLKQAMQLAPKSDADSMLGRHGEGMKMSLFHLRGSSSSRVFIFARQDQEATVAVLEADQESFASVTQLPIPAAFMRNPHGGTDADLISMAGHQKEATRKAVAKICRLPAGGGPAGDPHSPYDNPGQLAQVFSEMGNRAGKLSGLRIEIWDPVSGDNVQGKLIGPAVSLKPPSRGQGAPQVVVTDMNGDAYDLSEECSRMFLPLQQEVCTAQDLQRTATCQTHPYKLDIFVNGELAAPELHPWAKAVAAGQPQGFKRSGILTVGGADQALGRMQIIEMTPRVSKLLGSGILWVWPQSDAACNLKPTKLDIAEGVTDFLASAKLGSRGIERTRALWNSMSTMCGGEHHLTSMQLDFQQFKAICESNHEPGRMFLYAVCLERRLALVQLGSYAHAHIDRTKMHVRPYRPFAEALMRELVRHFFNQYLQAVIDGAGPSTPHGQQAPDIPAVSQRAKRARTSADNNQPEPHSQTPPRADMGSRSRSEPQRFNPSAANAGAPSPISWNQAQASMDSFVQKQTGRLAKLATAKCKHQALPILAEMKRTIAQLEARVKNSEA